MAGSKIIAPAALALAAVGAVIILVQSTTIGGLEDRVAAQEKALAKLAGSLSEANKPAPAPAPTPAPVADLSSVESRLAAVEREARSAAVLARAASARGPTDGDEDFDDGALVSLADDIAALRTDVDALLTGRGLETPEAKEAMRAAVDEAREQRRVERQARMEERRQAWVDDFVVKAKLSETQASSLRAALDARREAREAMREAVRNGDKTWADAREDMRAERRAFDKQLDEILDEEQRAAFDETQGGRRGRGNRGGRGDFRGGRGGR